MPPPVPVLLLATAMTACGSLIAPLAIREAGAREAIDALFGSESSARTFSRQRISTEHVEASPELRGRKSHFTYGEFDLGGFCTLLRAATPQPGELFVDIGSGCGRLVCAAAMMYEWSSACGIELLPDLHAEAVSAHAKLSALIEEGGDDDGIALAPCEFVCDEADVALPRLLTEAGSACVVFIFATAWPSTGPHLAALSDTLGRALPTGSRVITIDKQLLAAPDGGDGEWGFEEIQPPLELDNYSTFRSTGYCYRLVERVEPGEAGRGAMLS